MSSPTPLTFLEIRLPQDNEFTIESMSSLLSNFSTIASVSFFDWILGKKPLIASLEIVLLQNQIHFYVVAPTANIEFFRSQILAQYPSAITKETDDYLLKTGENNDRSRLFSSIEPAPQTRSEKKNDEGIASRTLTYTQLSLSRPYSYPLKTARDFRDTDPLVSILAPISRSARPNDLFVYQILLAPAPKGWQSSISSIIQTGILVDAAKNYHQAHPDKAVFEQKLQYPGLLTQINLLSTNPGLVMSVASSFGVYTSPRGNFIKQSQPGFFTKNQLLPSIVSRQIRTSLKTQILNTEELAALWHFPSELTHLPNIAWGKKLYADPPENLPVAHEMDEAAREAITFIGKTEFHNQDAIFGIKEGEDRRRHTYIIGKSGTGKTTLIANMAIDDIRKNRGVAIIDPHGDLCDHILDYIPSHRINDCCYFNPADPDYVYPLNVLEAQDESQRELVASGVISIFKKLYGQISWGPRLEHILRNAVLTLVNTPGSNLTHIVEILTHKAYRDQVVAGLHSPTLRNFWLHEFDQMDDKFRIEAISPILNKVGQFIASSKIRNTVAHAKSKVNIQEIMDQKKILIADLSTGKLGEDNSALLGAMLITQIQLSAMNRVYQSQSDRSDFYLYVDEFQNFATEAFIKILSEARKFRLNLIIANQYMNQLDRTIQDAIFGNVGSIISFVVGNQDAYLLAKEFGPKFPPEDLVKLGKYQIISKLSIDSETQEPFYATTLPPLACKNQQRAKLIRISQERWGKRKE